MASKIRTRFCFEVARMYTNQP